MEECVDGEYQDFKSKNGAYVRQHFFGKYPELLDLVADMSDDEIWALTRGGHDPQKVYAAYKAAVDNVGSPTVILAKTVKGYGMGEAGEGQNITHQQKKMGEDVLRAVPRPVRHRPGRRQDRRGAVPQAARGQPGGEIPARAPGRAGRFAAGAPAEVAVPAGAGAVGVRRPAQVDRGPRDLHHDGVRPDPDHPVAGQADRQARGADRARRVAHLRHGGPVPAVRDLLPGRAALPARGRQAADVLQGVPHRADAAGGHQRGRRHVVLDRRGHLATRCPTCR